MELSKICLTKLGKMNMVFDFTQFIKAVVYIKFGFRHAFVVCHCTDFSTANVH